MTLMLRSFLVGVGRAEHPSRCGQAQADLDGDDDQNDDHLDGNETALCQGGNAPRSAWRSALVRFLWFMD